jgi:hypothetical protein
MSERFPTPEKEMTMEEYIQLAKELSQNREGFLFEGIEDEMYAALKKADEQYPGFSTAIDELIPRCTAHGIKVALGTNPGSGNVFILPRDSDDIENDSIAARNSKVSDTMNPKLKKLILFAKGMGA